MILPSWFPKVPMRLKLLMLLLLTALIPLGLVSTMEVEATLNLGTSLADRTRDAIIEQVSMRLRQWISDKAAYVKSTRYQLVRTLETQARDVERCLATPPLPGPQPKIYFSEDINRGVLPPGMVMLEKYVHFDPALTDRKPVLVTFDHATFRWPSAQNRSADITKTSVMERLAPMSQNYGFLRNNFPDLIYWQYTAFENGLSCVYPGHGHAPSGFDPRQRLWYQEAKKQNGFIYLGPYVDASTRELVLTLAMPIHDPKGNFTGVTAMDIQVDDMANGLQLPPDWPAHSFAMLTTLEKTGDKTAIHILSRPGYSADGKEWNEEFEAHILSSTDENGMQSMIHTMQENLSGTALMPYEGKNCFWGYGPVHGTSMYVLAILPYDDLIEDARAAQAKAILHTRRQVQRMGLASLSVFLAALLISIVGSKTVTHPIHKLVDAAQRVAAGDLNTRVTIHTRDEIEELGDAFNQMVPQLQDRIRIKHSLNLAREVQQHLLPSKAPHAPGFDIAGRSIYCDETGGDYFDYLDLSRDGKSQLGIVLGDVTGHGIASAMLMATARSLLRADAHATTTLAHTMTHINRELASDIIGGRFMTFFFLKIDITERTARWSSAGHDPAIHYRAASSDFEEFPGNGPPLAIDPTVIYEEQGPATLKMHDVILLGTDGIWEAPNPKGERFGKDALREVIHKHANHTAKEIVEAIVSAVTQFRGTHPQADDITLVVIKVQPA